MSHRLPSPALCVLALLLGALTGTRARRWLYRFCLGYRIAADARIGIAYIRTARAELGPGTQIGHGTVIRNLAALEMGPGAIIGTFNWIYGMYGPTGFFAAEARRHPALVMAEGSALTSRHILDCTDQISIGRFALIAGFRCQILTHGIDIRTCRQSCAPVRIGAHALIGSGAMILKGADLPEGTVLGAGSVYRSEGGPSHHLWSGVPALAIRPLSDEAGWYQRAEGPVS